MKRTCLAIFALSCFAFTFAQTADQWAGIGAATRFGGSGFTLTYGQQDLFAPGTDARFGVSYFNAALTTTASPLS